MTQTMINYLIELERILEIVEERREYHRSEPYVNYLTALQPTRKERKSIFAQIFPLHKRQSLADVASALDVLPAGVFWDSYIRRS
jgi:hypothetical protein